MTLRLAVKFGTNRFRIAGVIPEKVISYDHSICLFGLLTIEVYNDYCSCRDIGSGK